MTNEQNLTILSQLPVLPLRDVVVFPNMVLPLFVGRARSIKALESAMDADKKILLIAQTNANEDDPGFDDIYKVGTVASILQLLKMPDGTVKVLVEGLHRAKLEAFVDQVSAEDNGHKATYSELESIEDASVETNVLSKTAITDFRAYIKLNPKISTEVLTSLESMQSAQRVADTIAAHLNIKNEQKQELLAIADVKDRLEKILGLMSSEMDLMQVEKRIRERVKKQMEKSQREYYLNEQMKAIQKELGDMDEANNELDLLEKRIKESGMPKDTTEKLLSELKKLKMMSPMSAEATVVRNYIDWALSMPWKKRTKVSSDLLKAQEILDADHYGLEKVKERIIEYLAVQTRVKKSKAAILCLVGPPGVGKTSLGESIAKATNRKFVRMSLGGVRDEAEIRGHRKTYIGSMPGKILQSLSKIKSNNPLFMLDEVDKMAMDFRGDPASALLEVLDPEQNSKFVDHYLEVDYDLSDVMFIATSNTMNIPEPLLDRMEVIRISGYTGEEKFEIAKRYLLPKQLKLNGLKETEVDIPDDIIRIIIDSYTKEAGVRNLDREISKIYRKTVKELLTNKKTKTVTVNSKKLSEFLGPEKFVSNKIEEVNQVGQVNGLAWTQVGGELLTVEATVMPGKGKQVFTGKLGDVMQESITTAISVIRARAHQLGLAEDFYQTQDIHLHVPEGATPKDGPSAGIGMCVGIVSALTKNPVKNSVAMTGEITLRGEVLAIGGLKEKLLAAQRANIKQVLIPHENKRDLSEMPESVLTDLEIIPVRWIEEVLDLALEKTVFVSYPSDESNKAISKKVKNNKTESGNITAH